MALRNQSNIHALFGLDSEQPAPSKVNFEGTTYFATNTGEYSILQIVGGVRSWRVIAVAQGPGTGTPSSLILKWSGTVPLGGIAVNTALLGDAIAAAPTTDGVGAGGGRYVLATSRTVRNVRARIISAAPQLGAVTVFQNGALTALTAVIPALTAANTTISVPGTLLFAAGDRLDISVGQAAGANALVIAVTAELVG